MIELQLPQLSAWLGSYLYPLFRLSAFFLVAPIFGSQLVPPRVRVGLAVLATLLIAPLLPPVPALDPLSIATLVLITQQVLLGVAIGFVMQMFFHVFVFSGWKASGTNARKPPL